MIGLDLFAGAGGMSIGAEWAGLRVRMAIEADPYAAKTYASNHSHVELIHSPIQHVERLDYGERDQPVVVFGGPPCQGFSTSNQRTRCKDNPSNWLFEEYLRIVGIVQPDWVVFENVKGIMETEGGAFLTRVSCELIRAGFTLSQWLLNAAHYGVPQRRSRLFLIGSRRGIRVEAPNQLRRAQVTVNEAIGDLPALQNGACIDHLPYQLEPLSTYARSLRGKRKGCGNHFVTRNATNIIERYSHIPQGGNWSDIPEHLMSNYEDRTRCHTGIYRRLMPDTPSVVIGNFRKNMLIHPTQNRGLSVREAARLQSFPDWFHFKGSIGFQQQQVGNAVPPLLAKAVFKTILKADRDFGSLHLRSETAGARE